MYFWNLVDLKLALARRACGDGDFFRYLLVYVGLGAVAGEGLQYFPYESINAWTYLQSALAVAIPIIGTIAAYRANGGRTGVDFAVRFFSIGFVVTIRFLVVLIPLMVVLLVYWMLSTDLDEPIETTPFEVIVMGGWYAALYWRLAKHVGDVAAASPSR